MTRLIGRSALGPDDTIALMMVRAKCRIVLEGYGIPQDRIDELLIMSPDEDWLLVANEEQESA